MSQGTPPVVPVVAGGNPQGPAANPPAANPPAANPPAANPPAANPPAANPPAANPPAANPPAANPPAANPPAANPPAANPPAANPPAANPPVPTPMDQSLQALAQLAVQLATAAEDQARQNRIAALAARIIAAVCAVLGIPVPAAGQANAAAGGNTVPTGLPAGSTAGGNAPATGSRWLRWALVLAAFVAFGAIAFRLGSGHWLPASWTGADVTVPAGAGEMGKKGEGLAAGATATTAPTPLGSLAALIRDTDTEVVGIGTVAKALGTRCDKLHTRLGHAGELASGMESGDQGRIKKALDALKAK